MIVLNQLLFFMLLLLTAIGTSIRSMASGGTHDNGDDGDDGEEVVSSFCGWIASLLLKKQ